MADLSPAVGYNPRVTEPASTSPPPRLRSRAAGDAWLLGACLVMVGAAWWLRAPSAGLLFIGPRYPRQWGLPPDVCGDDTSH